MKKLFFICLLALTHKTFSQGIPTTVLEKLKTAKPGEVVQLPGFIDKDFEKIPYKKVVLPGPQFIISDDPEYIRVPEAIALKETVQPGSVRLYVYNVNGVKEPQKMTRKITAVIKNIGESTLHFRMLKYASQKPSGNYFLVGKQGLHDFFAAKESQKIMKVKPGQTVAIDPQLEKNKVNFDELTHGLYEFVIDQPAEIAVLQTSPEKSGPKAYETITNIIPFGHKNAGRGLFGVSNYWIKSDSILSTDKPASQIVVADGIDDHWVVGKEGVSGMEAKLAGNYGVMYNVELNWKSTGGKGLALLTWNARSDSKWCSAMANAILVKNSDSPNEIVDIPSMQLSTKGAPESVVIQIFKPDTSKEIQTLKFTYSPPGASCLPTPLIFVPIDLR
ncbi:MAG TPA: copper amine oxidase [Pelobium sp.]